MSAPVGDLSIAVEDGLFVDAHLAEGVSHILLLGGRQCLFALAEPIVGRVVPPLLEAFGQLACGAHGQAFKQRREPPCQPEGGILLEERARHRVGRDGGGIHHFH